MEKKFKDFIVLGYMQEFAQKEYKKIKALFKNNSKKFKIKKFGKWE